jgi:hypothetical protein
MGPMLSGEMGAARATRMQEQAAHSRMVKQAKAAKAARRQESARQLEEIRTPRVLGILPWRSVARGRAVGKVRTRTAAEPC